MLKSQANSFQLPASAATELMAEPTRGTLLFNQSVPTMPTPQKDKKNRNSRNASIEILLSECKEQPHAIALRGFGDAIKPHIDSYVKKKTTAKGKPRRWGFEGGRRSGGVT